MLVKAERKPDPTDPCGPDGQPFHVGGKPVLDSAADFQSAVARFLEETDFGAGKLVTLGSYTDWPHSPFAQFKKHLTEAWASAAFDGQAHELHLLLCFDGTLDMARRTARKIMELLPSADLKMDKHSVIDMQVSGFKTDKQTDTGWMIPILIEARTVRK